MSRGTPLGRVLGLGSAKEGVRHWWAQRTSALALIFLGLWFAASIVALASDGGLGHASVVAWMAAPWNTVLLLVLLATACYHSALGVQVVIEDYVHAPALKIGSLVASRFAHALVAVAGAWAIVRVAFGGAS